MISKNGRKTKRKLGQARKSQSIFDNLGHPMDIKGKKVIFVGKKENPYSLTQKKSYEILDYKIGKNNWDEELKKRSKDNDYTSRDVNTDQSEDYFILIINDKGHKRKYSHLMFKMAEEKK